MYGVCVCVWGGGADKKAREPAFTGDSDRVRATLAEGVSGESVRLTVNASIATGQNRHQRITVPARCRLCVTRLPSKPTHDLPQNVKRRGSESNTIL